MEDVGRRAPSGRASKGNRMGVLLQQEEDENEADKAFYTQAFWDEAEEDNEYQEDADDEDGADSFDSDFGDSSEGSDDDEDKAEAAAQSKDKPAAKSKKSVYKDPKLKAAKGDSKATDVGASSSAARPKKKQRRGAAGGGATSANLSVQKGSLRASTKDATAMAAAKRQIEGEIAAQRAARIAAQGRSKGVEMRRLTQEDILAEAKQTELINRASLEMMLRVEEQKRKTVVRERACDGPRVRTKSALSDNAVVNTITFVDCELPPCIDDVAPDYPAAAKCAVTGQPAKYLDPVSGSPYATLEAFRMLRGRSGRRSSYTPALGPTSAPEGTQPLPVHEL